MIKFLILIIVIGLSADYPAILFLAIFYFAYRFLMKKKKRKKMNWSEAFNEEHRTGIAPFTDMVRKRRNPFAEEAIVFGINELSKMGILMAIPRPVIKDWAIRSISSDDRDAVSVDDIRQYLPRMTKRDASYLAASIQNTCRVYWDLKDAINAGCTHYIWKAGTDAQHRHMNNIVCPLDEPIPEYIVKDSSMHGPIYAGEGYHCLCWIAPVISDSDAPPSPIRIYENGVIKKISKREFVKRCVPNK